MIPTSPIGWTAGNAIYALEQRVGESGDVIIGSQLPSMRVLIGLLKQRPEDKHGNGCHVSEPPSHIQLLERQNHILTCRLGGLTHGINAVKESRDRYKERCQLLEAELLVLRSRMSEAT